MKGESILKIVKSFIFIVLICSLLLGGVFAEDSDYFPRGEETYNDEKYDNIIDILLYRMRVEHFNVASLLIFFLAIIHTMMTSKFQQKAHEEEIRYNTFKELKQVDKESKSIKAEIYHLLGEIEVVFGLWAIVLGLAVAFFYDWHTFTSYLDGLHYSEPLFIIVIMSIASSRPILQFFEKIMFFFVKLFGETLEAWWLTILVLGSLLGSFITEPAAMTICAFLLSEKVFSINPSEKLKYATLGLLFVNVSIGGALTNFASPPILMVVEPWGWTSNYVFINFGVKAVFAILISTGLYFIFLRSEFKSMGEQYSAYRFKKYIQKKFISQKTLEENFDELALLVSENTHFHSELDAYSLILKERIKEIAKKKLSMSEVAELDIYNAIDEKYDNIKLREFQRVIPGLLADDQKPQFYDPQWDLREDEVPHWITLVHLGFLIWTILNIHSPVLFMGGFLFFLGFFQVTSFYQNRLDLKPALLVAFFIAGIIIHGKLQAWWISPILANIPEFGINITAIGLTAFNDNAALTYLGTLVPDFSESLKYSLVTGALSGGGLTIIANSPNPVGISILKKYFDNGVSALGLFKYALLPTIIATVIFMVFK